MSTVRVAVIQAATQLFDPEAATNIVAERTQTATDDNAELVVFPEFFLGGFAKGSDFGALIGLRTPEGREEFRILFDSAIQIPGPETEQLGAIAARSGVHLVVGALERSGSTLYSSMLTFGPDGQLLGVRRKLSGVGSERIVLGRGDGSSLMVHDTNLGKLGTVMCWENLMPATRMAMYAQGIELYCAPTAVGTKADVITAQHVAREGRCFVLAAHLLLRASDLPEHYEPLRELGVEPVTSDGGSCIVGPDGSIIAGPIWGEEAMLVADLELQDISRWKYDFDVTGHFARPDIFQLSVDRTERSPVTQTGNSGQEFFKLASPEFEMASKTAQAPLSNNNQSQSPVQF